MHKILIYECSLKKKNPNIGSSLAVQWLGFGAFTDMVQLLVGELRSHKSQSAIKKKKKKLIYSNREIVIYGFIIINSG